MSTLVQVLNLNDSELDWVCRHMGHTKEVHLEHYRSMSGFIERMQIGKMLLMQDLNVQSQFVGKKLEEIDFPEIIKKVEENTLSSGSTQAEPTKRKMMDDDLHVESPQKKRKTERAGSKQRPEMKEQESKKKKGVARQKWSKIEEQELRKYLKPYFARKETPGKAAVEEAMEKSKANGGQLNKRFWHCIVLKMSNYTKQAKKAKKNGGDKGK